MKRILHLSLWAIIAFLLHFNSLKAQTGNPTLDAQWTVKSNNGSQLVLELGIRTNTSEENLGPAQFIFEFDDTYVSFDGGGSPGGSETDYTWQSGFGPTVYTGTNTGVTQSYIDAHTELINIDLDFTHGTGIAISSTSDYTPVIDLVFAVSDPTKSTTITWAMSEGTPPTFDDVQDDGYGSIDEGTFNGIVVNPLPVTLTNFSAQMKNSETILSWTTASEINNNYFTVERSIDGEHFNPLKQIKGSGTSESKNYYTTYDEIPLPGVSYYRLSQTDFNGASQIFHMVAVNNSDAVCENIEITNASFNQGSGNVCYVLPDDGTLIITISDINGKLINKEQVAGQKGSNKYSLPVSSSLKPGLYFILLDFKSQSASTKMIIP